jgi:hypothetical protein
MQNDFDARFGRCVSDEQIAENDSRKVFLTNSSRRHFLGFGAIVSAFVAVGCSSSDAPVPLTGTPAPKGNRARFEAKAQKAESLPSAKK